MRSVVYFCLCSIFWSCQPELKPLGQGTTAPVACHLLGELDGQPLLFEAGIQGNFLFTDVATNSLEVIETSASIKPDPCDGCGNYLEITIRDQQRNDGSLPMVPDTIFQIKTYPFQLGAAGSTLRRIRLRQSNLDGLTPVQNTWSVFNLASTLVAQSTALEAEFVLPDGNYSTQLISRFANGCSDTSTNSMVLDTANASGSVCTAEMRISRVPGSTSMFLDTVNVRVPNPNQVIWRVGGLTLTGGSLFLMTDSFLNLNDVFEVELEVVSASCTATTVQRISKNPSIHCATNFRVSSIQSVDPLQLGHIRIKWTDAQGQSFISEKEEQPNWSVFEITAIDSFPRDRNGLPTVLLSGRINARLFSSSGPSPHKDLRNAEFKLAFPYKP